VAGTAGVALTGVGMAPATVRPLQNAGHASKPTAGTGRVGAGAVGAGRRRQPAGTHPLAGRMPTATTRRHPCRGAATLGPHRRSSSMVATRPTLTLSSEGEGALAVAAGGMLSGGRRWLQRCRQSQLLLVHAVVAGWPSLLSQRPVAHVYGTGLLCLQLACRAVCLQGQALCLQGPHRSGAQGTSVCCRLLGACVLLCSRSLCRCPG
jgi:hypothetical protein